MSTAPQLAILFMGILLGIVIAFIYNRYYYQNVKRKNRLEDNLDPTEEQDFGEDFSDDDFVQGPEAASRRSSKLPANLISSHTALEMIQFFQDTNRNGHIVSGHLEWRDFNLYLKYISNKVKQSRGRISGLEFYFARYPESGDISSDQRGLQTIVFFPTYKSKGKHIPIDPILSARQGRMVSIKKVNQGMKKRSSMPSRAASAQDSANQNDTTCAYNRSRMSPPRQDTI